MEEFFGEWYQLINPDILVRILNTLDPVTDSICPSVDKVFNAFTYCPYSKLSLVILGTEPYCSRDMATGLAYANPMYVPDEACTPELKLFREACERGYDDLPFYESPFPSLIPLASQGVLLLNTALTVIEGKPKVHTDLWRPFIADFLKKLSDQRKDLVYLLLGKTPESYERYIHSGMVLKCKSPEECLAEGIQMPDAFKAVDDVMLEMNKQLIYWK